ncbi:hypothetical protein ERO13_A07G219000v2 [Gossypium hirsutum]|uniref:Transmembrane protein n=5 Tax=Gossypium TaxID=3633 RepID=A0A5J5V7I1_GOSBA|nr:hypothetical protein ES319_A07G237600v1 [Gossypium barbadense]KAG4193400.1 hypothetical protein ERO13_A07G219000v2 [Gossypium hirsutum]TYH11429.1 hypothetical protein ES288_A07G257600v1 [Gossypium darwinii]TYI20674.1 hypothetical protein ES332_A07G255200v1 [Gossypium tomentosum]
MEMKHKALHFFLLLIMFLSFMLLITTPEARRFALSHADNAVVKANPSQREGGGFDLEKVFQVLDLLKMKDSSGPSGKGEGH